MNWRRNQLCDRAAGVHGALPQVHEESVESLWFRITVKTSTGDNLPSVDAGQIRKK